MLKIYFNNTPLFITKEPNKEVEPYLSEGKSSTTTSLDDLTIKNLLDTVKSNTMAGIILNSEEEALKAVKKHFLLVPAAGGLVFTNNQQVLIIYRRGKWDLPKGKLDEGEDLAQCAIREVEEETGLKNLTIQRPLCVTYHTYEQDGQPILKESHWYLMNAEQGQILTPQSDEDIEKCEWVNVDNLTPYLENTHPSILDVIKEGGKYIRKASN